MNIEQSEDIQIFLGMSPITCTVPSVTYSIAMDCGSCEFPVSCSQGKPPSAKGLSHIN